MISRYLFYLRLMFKNEDGTLNASKILTAVVMLFNLIGIAGATIVFDYAVEQSALRLLGDPMSKLSQTVDQKAEEKAKSMTKSTMMEQAKVIAMATALDGFRGMDVQELTQYLNNKFDFADTMQSVLADVDPRALRENHEWIAEQRAQLEAAATVTGNEDNVQTMGTCGDILVIGGIPALFRDENNELLKVYKGKPSRSDGKCYVYDVYYLRSSRDQVRVLRTISDVILRAC